MAENDQLTRDIEDIFNDVKDPIRKMQERIWFRNILYYMGEQYIDWIISEATFRRRQMNPLQPTPVANIVRDFVRAKKALYLNRTYGIRVWPNSEDQNDKDAAKLGEQVLQSADLENEEAFADEVDDLTEMLVMLGTAFMRTYPYKSGSMFGMDYNGKIIEMGDVGNQLLLPFNVYPDIFGRRLRYHRHVGIKSLKPTEWVEDTFYKKIQSTGDDAQVTNYEKRLMKMVSDVAPWKGAGLMPSQLLDMKAEKLCLFKEVEFAPTSKYKNGRYAIMANHEFIKVVDHLPIPVENNKWHYTLTDFHYNRVVGRFWSDGGVNDLISPQNSINEIDKALEMNRKGLGRPILWWPEGSAMERMNKGDLSFLAIKYNPLLSGGQKPEIDRGTALPNQFLDERNVHKETIQESSGDPKNILRGKAPTAKASGVMVDILSEKAEAGHLPDTKSYFRSLKQVYKKRLILSQEIYTENRLLKIAGEGSKIYVKNFKGSDLRSNHDVRLEMDTSSSTSQTSKTEVVLKLVETGFFGEQTAVPDPQVRAQIMKRLGLGNFTDRTNIHVERAERENTKIANDDIDNIMLTQSDQDENGEPVGEPKVANPDDLFPFDDHVIHYEVHRAKIVSPEFDAMTESQQVVLLTHAMAHQNVVTDQQKQAMVEQAMMEGKLQPEGQGEQR